MQSPVRPDDTLRVPCKSCPSSLLFPQPTSSRRRLPDLAVPWSERWWARPDPSPLKKPIAFFNAILTIRWWHAGTRICLGRASGTDRVPPSHLVPFRCDGAGGPSPPSLLRDIRAGRCGRVSLALAVSPPSPHLVPLAHLLHHPLRPPGGLDDVASQAVSSRPSASRIFRVTWGQRRSGALT